MTPTELARLFRAEREKFAAYFPRIARAGLSLDTAHCSPGSPCRKRDVAWCHYSPPMVFVLERALGLSRNNLVGLIRHELGHLSDPTPQARGAEARADRIARDVTGRHIRYDRDDIQTAGKGRATRPRYLHQ